MSAFYIRYPVSGANPSIGAIGQPAPGDATLVAGIGPDGNLHALSTDNSGVLNVNAAIAPGGTVTSNQGLPAALGNAWPVKLTDGTIVNTFDVNGLRVSASLTGTATVSESGFIRANVPTRNVYTVTPVTTGAYVQLVASTTLATKEIEIFDSSGQTLVLATGAIAAEVDQMLIFPGGNGRVKLAIPAASRVSIKAISATADVGENSINYYG